MAQFLRHKIKRALSIKDRSFLDYPKAWKIMTEESDNKESTSLEKLSIDNPSDFQFHAAYLTYSEIYEKTTNPEIRKQHEIGSQTDCRLRAFLVKLILYCRIPLS